MEKKSLKRFVEQVINGMRSLLSKFKLNHVTEVQEYQDKRVTGQTEALRQTMRGQFMKLKEKGLSIRIITL